MIPTHTERLFLSVFLSVCLPVNVLGHLLVSGLISLVFHLKYTSPSLRCYVCACVSFSICLYIIYIYIYIYISTYLSAFLSAYLSFYVSIYLSIYLSPVQVYFYVPIPMTLLIPDRIRYRQLAVTDQKYSVRGNQQTVLQQEQSGQRINNNTNINEKQQQNNKIQ